MIVGDGVCLSCSGHVLWTVIDDERAGEAADRLLTFVIDDEAGKQTGELAAWCEECGIIASKLLDARLHFGRVGPTVDTRAAVHAERFRARN